MSDFNDSESWVEVMGFLNSAKAASFWVSMVALAADSRSGMEDSRRERDARVWVDVEERHRNLKSRNWDFSEMELWREEKWSVRVVNNWVHLDRIAFRASRSSMNF